MSRFIVAKVILRKLIINVILFVYVNYFAWFISITIFDNMVVIT